jgi:glutaredoxin
MKNDVQCPYCDQALEINHDDGKGYEENELHQQECRYCKKIFVYMTEISFSYEATKANCLNDSEHVMEAKPDIGGFYPNRKICRDCGHEETGYFDKTARDKAVNENMKLLRKLTS